MTGAQFEIRIDGTPRTYRDRKDYAIEAARFLKSRQPHSIVEVKDLQSGIGIGRSTAFAWKKDDPEFSAKWDEARETAWDKLEGKMYSLGMDDGEVSAIEKTLKAFRPERWREPRGDSDEDIIGLVRHGKGPCGRIGEHYSRKLRLESDFAHI